MRIVVALLAAEEDDRSGVDTEGDHGFRNSSTSSSSGCNLVLLDAAVVGVLTDGTIRSSAKARVASSSITIILVAAAFVVEGGDKGEGGVRGAIAVV